MGLFQWIAAKFARPISTEHPTPNPDEVVPTIVADEGPEGAAAAARRRRAVAKLQEELDRHLAVVASGGPASIVAFRDLIEFLLRLTVMDPVTRTPCLKILKEGKSHVMRGRAPLNDGRFLKFMVHLTAPDHRRLTVGALQGPIRRGARRRRVDLALGRPSAFGPQTATLQQQPRLVGSPAQGSFGPHAQLSAQTDHGVAYPPSRRSVLPRPLQCGPRDLGPAPHAQ